MQWPARDWPLIPARYMRRRVFRIPGPAELRQQARSTMRAWQRLEPSLSMLLGLRLNGKADRGFRFTRDFGLVLQVSFAFVKRRHDCEQNRRPEHDPKKEHEIACALQFHRPVGILDDEIDRRGELVPERDREQVSAHDQ